MPKIISKNSKVKYGLSPPVGGARFYSEPTDEANIPMWQSNGTVKYISEESFNWLMQNGKIESNQSKSSLPKEDQKL